MTRRRRVALYILLIAIGFYIVLTGGGIVVGIDEDFGGQRSIVLADLEADIWLSPRRSSFPVPFVFYYDRASAPFGISLQVSDYTNMYEAIEVHEVLCEYRDGSSAKEIAGWRKVFKPETRYSSSSSEGVSAEKVWAINVEIPNVVLKHLDVRITLSGYLSKSDGEGIPFKITEMFTPESLWQVATNWRYLAAA